MKVSIISKIICAIVCTLFSLQALAHDAVTVHDYAPKNVFVDHPVTDLHPPASDRTLGELWQSFLKSPSSAKLQADWFTLYQLNLQAGRAWQAILTCANGDPAQARQVYLDLSSCPDGAHQIHNLFHSLQAFLVSTKFSTQNSPDMSVHVPPFHPLLTQMLLEQASSGFPFLWGDEICSSLGCWFGTPIKAILTSPFDRLFSHSDRDKKIFDNLMTLGHVFSGQSTGSDVLSPKFQALRATYAALQTLRLLLLGDHSCTEFGLWPWQTTMLTVAFGSWQGDFHEGFEDLLYKGLHGLVSFPAQLYVAERYSCAQVQPNLSWQGATTWLIYNLADPRIQIGWDMLAQAGAWRSLNERNGEL